MAPQSHTIKQSLCKDVKQERKKKYSGTLSSSSFKKFTPNFTKFFQFWTATKKRFISNKINVNYYALKEIYQ